MACTKCPATTYQPKTGAAACTPCPAGATCDGTYILEPVCKAGEKKGEQTCTPCPVGQYNVNGDGICKACPPGAVCAGGTDVAVIKDHWVSPIDLAKGVLDVYRCRPGWCCDGVSCPVFSPTGDLLINAGNVSLNGVDALSGSICTGKKMGVLRGLDLDLNWCPREQNEMADALTNGVGSQGQRWACAWPLKQT